MDIASNNDISENMKIELEQMKEFLQEKDNRIAALELGNEILKDALQRQTPTSSFPTRRLIGHVSKQSHTTLESKKNVDGNQILTGNQFHSQTSENRTATMDPSPTAPPQAHIEANPQSPQSTTLNTKLSSIRFEKGEFVSGPVINGQASIRRRTPIRTIKNIPHPKQADDAFINWALEYHLDFKQEDLANAQLDLEFRRKFLMDRTLDKDQERFIIDHIPNARKTKDLYFNSLILLSLFSFPYHLAVACLYCYSRLSHPSLVRLVDSFHKKHK